jgi:predicted patatin/cPLA2 family phospholipase
MNLDLQKTGLVLEGGGMRGVNRIEKDIKKLTDLYEEGYACAEKVLTPYLKV